MKCETCSHRNKRGVCEVHRMLTYDNEYCLYYNSKPTFTDELAKWTVVVVMAFIAFCFCCQLFGCAKTQVITYHEPDSREYSEAISELNEAIAESEIVAESEEAASKEEASSEEEPSAASSLETASQWQYGRRQSMPKQSMLCRLPFRYTADIYMNR